MSEPISVFSAARRLGEHSGWDLTNLHMQKLLYLAHMYYLGANKEPLVDGDFEAWDYGPVQPKLYHYLKRYGADIIPSAALSFAIPVENKTACVYLDAVVDQLPRSRLMAITHWEEGAWAKNYERGSMGILLTNTAIAEEYENRMRDNG